MQNLIDGIHQFQKTISDAQRKRFERLAEGQHPEALFITCSDSRVDPNLLTQKQPGELFVIRNAGNIVPPYGAGAGGEAATIEYAVNVLKVPDIIICGHSHCGAMAGLLNPDSLEQLEAVRQWLTFAEATAQVMENRYGDISDSADRLNKAVEQNVLVQLENLRTHPCVAKGISRDELRLHGWTYRFENSQVSAYNVKQEQFCPIE